MISDANRKARRRRARESTRRMRVRAARSRATIRAGTAHRVLLEARKPNAKASIATMVEWNDGEHDGERIERTMQVSLATDRGRFGARCARSRQSTNTEDQRAQEGERVGDPIMICRNRCLASYASSESAIEGIRQDKDRRRRTPPVKPRQYYSPKPARYLAPPSRSEKTAPMERQPIRSWFDP